MSLEWALNVLTVSMCVTPQCVCTCVHHKQISIYVACSCFILVQKVGSNQQLTTKYKCWYKKLYQHKSNFAVDLQEASVFCKDCSKGSDSRGCESVLPPECPVST